MKIKINKEYKERLLVKSLLAKVDLEMDPECVSKINFVDADTMLSQIFSDQYSNYSMSFVLNGKVFKFGTIAYKIEMVEKSEYIFWLGAYGLYFFKNTEAFKKRVKKLNDKIVRRVEKKVKSILA